MMTRMMTTMTMKMKERHNTKLAPCRHTWCSTRRFCSPQVSQRFWWLKHLTVWLSCWLNTRNRKSQVEHAAAPTGSHRKFLFPVRTCERVCRGLLESFWHRTSQVSPPNGPAAPSEKQTHPDQTELFGSDNEPKTGNNTGSGAQSRRLTG